LAAPEFDRFVDLVCEGGGVKGIGLAGAYSVLDEQGYKPQNVAGTSAGAITAALIAAGYSSAELKDIIFGLDFRRFEDQTWQDRIPLVGTPLSILTEEGIFKGDDFLEWMRELLAAKGIHTFADLKTEWSDPKYDSRLQVIASDISARQLLVLPRDAGKLGLKPDELKVAEAVRMSMSIPIFFKPVRISNRETNHEHQIVDGGMLSNFPVWLFDCEDGARPDWPTFGLLLVEPDPKVPIGARLPDPEHAPTGVRGLTQLLSGMLHTMMEAHDRLYLEKAQFARTIPIPTLGVGTTEFDLPRERAEALYQSGRLAAATFLQAWDFQAYIAEFRTGKTHSRRAEVASELDSAAASIGSVAGSGVAIGGSAAAATGVVGSALPGEPLEPPTRPTTPRP
jgi:NTE family protein